MSEKKPRIWFYPPERYWFGWRTLIPFYRGGDELNRHTIMLGWTVTGRVVIPYFQCVDAFEYPQACPWHKPDPVS